MSTTPTQSKAEETWHGPRYKHLDKQTMLNPCNHLPVYAALIALLMGLERIQETGFVSY